MFAFPNIRIHGGGQLSSFRILCRRGLSLGDVDFS